MSISGDVKGTELNDRIPKREIASWAMFDFANSSYVTVVSTAIFNAYFVGTVASGLGTGKATLYLTSVIALSNFLVVLTAPVVGAVADFTASKKRLLLATSICLVIATIGLGFVGPGQVVFGLFVLAIANLMFGTGEDLIAAFLPEIASKSNMGRISAIGWATGYIGGLGVLATCLAYIKHAENLNQGPEAYVPVTMWIVAGVFSVAALPTFLFLKERIKPSELPKEESYFSIGFNRLIDTFKNRAKFKDMFVFLLSLLMFTSGSTTVAVMAAVYAKEVMKFETSETVLMIMVVNIAGAIGAFIFGAIQDKIGSKKAVSLSLLIWIVAVALVIAAQEKAVFWVAAVLMGSAMGASASAGRALIGQFAPPSRAAEFFGLWGLAVKSAAILGPLSYGLFTYLSNGNFRVSLFSTIGFFVVGLIILFFVDEERGIVASENS